MRNIAAQVSLYPLRRPRLSAMINDALRILSSSGLDVCPGAMSTMVTGSTEKLFECLKEVFRWSAEQGDIVMIVTVSNACPLANSQVEPVKRNALKRARTGKRRKKGNG